MSLIHKALQKASSSEPPSSAPSPENGERPPLFEEPATSSTSANNKRTAMLAGVMIIALGFAVYRNVVFFKQKKAKKNKPAITAVVPSPANVAPATANSAGEANADADVVWSSDVEKLVNRGKNFYATKRFDEALAAFNEALNLSGNNPEILNNIGLVNKLLSHYADAEAAYQKAVAINPNCSECYNNMGVLKIEMRQPFEGAQFLKKAIDISPTYPDPHFNLAVLMENEGNYRTAISEYKLFLDYTDSEDEGFLQTIRYRIEELSQ